VQYRQGRPPARRADAKATPPALAEVGVDERGLRADTRGRRVELVRALVKLHTVFIGPGARSLTALPHPSDSTLRKWTTRALLRWPRPVALGGESAVP
jgi:hypothetical protein